MTDTARTETAVEESGEACCGAAGRIASLFFVGAAVAVASMALSRLVENLRGRAPENVRPEPAGPRPARPKPARPEPTRPEPSGPSASRKVAEAPPASAVASPAAANDDRAPVGSPIRVFHVEPKDGDWVVTAENGEMLPEVFPTKKDALTAGRAAARSREPSRLVIHRMDGTVSGDHSYGEMP